MGKLVSVAVILLLFIVFALGGEVMAFQIKSAAFKPQGAIPAKYTCDSIDISPPLSWDDPPGGTQSFVLIVDDPDAPLGTWVHWVLYDLPHNLSEVHEGVSKKDTLETGAKQGKNDFRRIGYGGPCPPPGSPHRYFFKLYALNAKLNLKPGLTKQEVEKSMQGKVLAQTQLIGKYKR